MWWSDSEIWPAETANPSRVAPWYALDAPLHDQVVGKKKNRKGEDVDDVKEGYRGKPKGLKQILWERGLWKDGMIQKITKETDSETDSHGRGEDLSMVHVLENCYDFATEKTAFMWLMIERGHIPEMSPKCHPEVAGVGIEYSWGKSKQFFRRHTDHVGKHLHQNIAMSLDTAPGRLPLYRVRRYARKSRAYRRAYEGRNEMDHEDIEKHVKLQKAHRGADRLDVKFLREA